MPYSFTRFALFVLFLVTSGAAQNTEPEFKLLPKPLAYPDQMYKGGISVFDADHDPVEVSANGLPDWLELVHMDSSFYSYPRVVASGGTQYCDQSHLEYMEDGTFLVLNQPRGAFNYLYPDGSTEYVDLPNMNCTVMNFAVDAAGQVYMVDDCTRELWRYSPENGFELLLDFNTTTWNNCPAAVEFDPQGNLYFRNCGSMLKMSFHENGDVDTLVSMNTMDAAEYIAITDDGTIYTSQPWGSVFKWDPTEANWQEIPNSSAQGSRRDLEADGNSVYWTTEWPWAVYEVDQDDNVSMIADLQPFQDDQNGDWCYANFNAMQVRDDVIYWVTPRQMVYASYPVQDYLLGTPSSNHHGEHTFSLSAYDGQGGSAFADVTIFVDSTVVFASWPMEFDAQDHSFDDHVSEHLVLRRGFHCEDPMMLEPALINVMEEDCWEWRMNEMDDRAPTGTMWLIGMPSEEARPEDWQDGLDGWVITENYRDPWANGLVMWDFEDNQLYGMRFTYTSYNNDSLSYMRHPMGPGPQVRPHIVQVHDVPGDQGGRVYLSFEKSYFDTETASRESQSYTVQRHDPMGWVSVASVGAYSPDGPYVVEVSTHHDSSSFHPEPTLFRVIAHMNYGNFMGNEMEGYSVDNLAPPAPGMLSGEVENGLVNLVWQAAPTPDFAAFNIYRSETAEVIPGEDTYIGSSPAPYFSEEMGTASAYTYVVTAVDVNENEGEPSAPVTVSTMTGNVDEALIPDEFALLQNYPNPFNPSTTIRFGLPETAQVSAVVYDLRGSVVQTLVNGQMEAGWHDLQWQPEQGVALNSAVYLVRIKAGVHEDMIKMLYLK